MLRFPGKVLGLPLSGLGYVSNQGLRYFENGDAVSELKELLLYEQKIHLAVLPASLGDRTGFGLGVLWGAWPIPRNLVLDLSASNTGYNRERVILTVGGFDGQYLNEWRPRDGWFGVGLQAPHNGASNLAQHIESARLGYTWSGRLADSTWLASLPLNPNKLMVPLPRRTVAGVFAGPRTVFVTHGRDPERPSFQSVYPSDSLSSYDKRIEHLVYGARITNDERWGRPHWAHGWRGMFEVQRFEKSIEALAIKNAHTDAIPFTRLNYFLEGGWSFGVDPRTLRLSINVIDQILDTSKGTFLISDMSHLGGSAGLTGFEPGRFNDIDMVLGKATYVFPLSLNLEGELHFEAGGVYPSLSQVQGDVLKGSYGVRLRFRTLFATIGMVGLDWSSERMRFSFSVGPVD